MISLLLIVGVVVSVLIAAIGLLGLLFFLRGLRYGTDRTDIPAYRPYGGVQETARRKRQIERGYLTVANGLERKAG